MNTRESFENRRGRINKAIRRERGKKTKMWEEKRQEKKKERWKGVEIKRNRRRQRRNIKESFEDGGRINKAISRERGKKTKMWRIKKERQEKKRERWKRVDGWKERRKKEEEEKKTEK